MDGRWPYSVLLFCCCFSCCRFSSVEKPLLDSLFLDYDPDALPREKAANKLELNIQLSIDHILEIDEKSQRMSVIGTVTLTWLDQFLRWNSTEYDGVTTIEVPASRIWTPQVSLLNSAGDFISEIINDIRAIVYYDGTVAWRTGGTFTTYCTIAVQLYPFDRQECLVQYGVVSRSIEQVVMKLPQKRALFQDGASFEEGATMMWQVESTTAKIRKVGGDNAVGRMLHEYHVADFHLYLRRSGVSILINILAPCLFLTALSLMVPWLPAESGERISLGITCFLAFSVYMVIIDDKMPAQTADMPLLQQYLLIMMIFTAVVVACAILSLAVYHQDPKNVPPKCILYLIRRCKCFRHCTKKPAGPAPHQLNNSDTTITDIDLINTPPASQDTYKTETTTSNDVRVRVTKTHTPFGSRRRTKQRYMDNGIHGHHRSHMDVSNSEKYKLSSSASSSHSSDDEDEQADYSLEWARCSRIIDMAVFAIILLAGIAVTIVMIIVIPQINQKSVPDPPPPLNTSGSAAFLGGGQTGGGQIGRDPFATPPSSHPTGPGGLPLAGSGTGPGPGSSTGGNFPPSGTGGMGPSGSGGFPPSGSGTGSGSRPPPGSGGMPPSGSG